MNISRLLPSIGLLGVMLVGTSPAFAACTYNSSTHSYDCTGGGGIGIDTAEDVLNLSTQQVIDNLSNIPESAIDDAINTFTDNETLHGREQMLKLLEDEKTRRRGTETTLDSRAAVQTNIFSGLSRNQILGVCRRLESVSTSCTGGEGGCTDEEISTAYDILALYGFQITPGSEADAWLRDILPQIPVSLAEQGSNSDDDVIATWNAINDYIDAIASNGYTPTQGGTTLSQNNASGSGNTANSRTKTVASGSADEDRVTVTDPLSTLFLVMFGEAPTTTQYNTMQSALQEGKTLEEIAANLQGDVFKTRYPGFLLNSEFADKVADALLGENASDAEKTFAVNWITQQVNNGLSHTDAIVKSVKAFGPKTNPAPQN